MTEFEVECIDRKRLAKMARCKKNGSRSKKCRLPSDDLTNSQIRKLNGEIVTVKLSEAISWEGFKALTRELQVEYINNIVKLYDATATAIASMMGVTACTFTKYIKGNSLGVNFGCGHRMSKESKAAWEKFLRGKDNNAEDVLQEQAERCDIVMGECNNECASDQPVSESKMKMSKVSLSFNGKLDINAICNSLKSMFGNETVVCDTTLSIDSIVYADKPATNIGF